jgi:hypothetical protein
MHRDKVQLSNIARYSLKLNLSPSWRICQIHTHVISSIVHIAHKYDNESQPWPIQIEDHYGNIESVALEPGEVI